ncbi:flavodoxin [[Pantoea] beijingensis]|uniref:Flavodoxin n=1 Tax=[Pantoea] beijingensis TaxID=1324864 RepID=A0A443IE12_9GAMM|nr:MULTISPECIES: NAD(P)H-dependent oxidoreductase [Erwiniaceae]RWR02333.1 flavodoxin [[Pantoea] beijingensis]
MKNALIINGFQMYEGFSKGELTTTMIKIIQDNLEEMGYEVQTTNIEGGYVIEDEVEKHVWADLIILQTPVHWFGAPWIYKKYADEVFTSGLLAQKLIVDDGRTRADPTKQYGTGGLMQGKKYMLSLTWNAPEEAFNNKDQYLFQGMSADEVLLANTSNYRFCGAEILPSYSCYNVIKDPKIADYIDGIKEHLKKFIQ